MAGTYAVQGGIITHIHQFVADSPAGRLATHPSVATLQSGSCWLKHAGSVQDLLRNSPKRFPPICPVCNSVKHFFLPKHRYLENFLVHSFCHWSLFSSLPSPKTFVNSFSRHLLCLNFLHTNFCPQQSQMSS